MLLQRILASLDILVSKLFKLEHWTTGSMEGIHERTFYVRHGHLFGIVGVDGFVHTMMHSCVVKHRYNGKVLIRRIRVIKDLKMGERLATPEELEARQKIRHMGRGGFISD